LTNLLEIKNIETYYDLIYAIRGASLSIDKGTVTTILCNMGPVPFPAVNSRCWR